MDSAHDSESNNSPPPEPEDDESRFIRLTGEHRSATGRDKGRLEEAIIQLVDENFRRCLRPLIALTFGPQVARDDNDHSLRYTALANDFFVRVLDKRPDAIWRAQTLNDLRKFASRVITNQILDYLRRKKRGAEFLRELAPLVEDRQRRFRDRFGFDLSDNVLECLERWRMGEDPQRRDMALLLLHRYIDCMPYEEIADQLEISTPAAYRLRDTAIRTLKTQFESD